VIGVNLRQFIVLGFLAAAPAAAEECPQHFAKGTPPVAVTEEPGQRVLLCFEAFAVLHSGETKTPLYSAEHLESVVLTAIPPKRTDRFHPEPRLPLDQRAWAKDYAARGWDRGHMAADSDMRTVTAGYEADSLANIVPQLPAINRGAWRVVEDGVRHMAMRRGELFTITGPIFADDKRSGRVRVPYAVFKIAYDPKTDEAVSIVASNRTPGRAAVVNLDELESVVGFRFFENRPRELSAADVKGLVGK
jgi:endonuclease G